MFFCHLSAITTITFLKAQTLFPAMFNVEMDRVIAEITSAKAQQVVIQLPDGLKMRAQEIADTLERETGATIYIWFSSCFGGCDLPQGLPSLGIDLLIQFGHNLYHKTPKEW